MRVNLVKKCSICKIDKTLEEFDFNKRAKDGRTARCKECRKIYSIEYRQKNHEKLLDYEAKLRNKHNGFKERKDKWKQENLDHVKEQQKEYYEANKEELKKYYKDWAEKNRDKLSESQKKFRKTEKGKEASYKRNHRRRSKIYNVEFRGHKRKEILDRDNWKCKICNKNVHDDSKKPHSPDKANIDHIIPISKGGNSEPSNLQTLCYKCNIKKSDKVLN
jgi:5-methylcytosine-specific restriction endonuclease McrA